MIEFRDFVGLAGWAGWLWGAYIYWRSTLSKQPLVMFELGKAAEDRVAARLTVRNRGPEDLFTHRVALREPAGAIFANGQSSFEWSRRVKAFGSGEFPSAFCNFEIALPTGTSSGGGVMVEITISSSRDASRSKRYTRRQSIQMVNKTGAC